jgi:exodeoxyribonuclease VII small subunit
MADESYSFSTARTRLEAIVTQVRKKDTSLEKSLDLLEEGVRLANACTELIDQADWASAEAGSDPEAALAGESAGEVAEDEPAKEVAVDDSADEIAEDDPAEDAWADDGVPADELGADDDPSADER